MIFASSMIGVFLGLAIVTKAHFTLQFPAAIGPYDDTKLIDGPCDGYDPTSASVFQDWPWRGEAVTLLTTHPVVTWDFNAALFSSVTKSQSSFIPLTETLQQNNGTGYLCFGQVPGKKEWVGQKAIVQIIQHAPDGDLTSCMAVTFTDAAADLSGGGACKNDSGIAKKPYDIFFLPGTGSDLNSGSTSSSTSGSTSTTSRSTSGTLGTESTSSTDSGTISAPTTSKSATGTGTATSNSTKTTATSTSSPSAFTGASDKTHAGSLLEFAGLTFAALMVFGL